MTLTGSFDYPKTFPNLTPEWPQKDAKLCRVSLHTGTSRSYQLIIANCCCCHWRKKLAIILAYYRELVLLTFTEDNRDHVNVVQQITFVFYRNSLWDQLMIATWFCCPVHKKFAIISFYYREFLLLSFGEEARDNIKLLSRVVTCPLQRKLAIISAYLRKCLLVSFYRNALISTNYRKFLLSTFTENIRDNAGWLSRVSSVVLDRNLR